MDEFPITTTTTRLQKGLHKFGNGRYRFVFIIFKNFFKSIANVVGYSIKTTCGKGTAENIDA